MGQVNYSSSASSSASSGIGFTGLLTILFVGLKLTGVINWPWIWVLSPIWIGFSLAVGIVILFLIVVGIAILWDKKKYGR